MLNSTDLDSQLTGLLTAPHWYVGLSGGVDSTVLLHLLCDWRKHNPGSPPLSAIHINHGLQSEAAGWQRYCEDICRSLEIPCISRTVVVQPSGSGEAAARVARYRAFEALLPPEAIVFLGHHLDDQVETFFLRLLRGAGVEGLAAMPRGRALGAAQLARPLLDYRRSEIEDYAAHHSLEYVIDPSNSNTAMDRNFLRAELLPLLATRWPAYRRAVIRASSHMAAAAKVLEDTVGVPETVYSRMGDAGLLLSQLNDAPDEIAATRLRSWLRSRGHQAPDTAAIDEFLRQLRVAGDDAIPRLACSSCTLQRYRDTVYLLPDCEAPPVALSLNLVPGASLEVPGVGTVSLLPSQGDGLELASDEQLVLRCRQGGERCRLPGRSGSRSLKVLMQEWSVPPWWRDRVPLVYLGGELVAVGDLARCETSRWRLASEAVEPLWIIRWKPPVGTTSD